MITCQMVRPFCGAMIRAAHSIGFASFSAQNKRSECVERVAAELDRISISCISASRAMRDRSSCDPLDNMEYRNT